MSEAKITLGAVDNTRAAFDSVKGSLAGLHTSATKVMGVLGATVSIAGLVAFVKGGIDAADALDEMSGRIGVSVKDLSSLQLAYKQAGMGPEAMQSSLAKLSKGMSDNNTGLKALSINTRNADGSLRTTTGVLLDVADKFEGMQDGASKTALAMEIFGKSGAEMVPLLNGGSASIREMTEMAEKLGLVIEDSAAAQAGKFNDTLELLSLGVSGVGQGIAAELLPTLNGLAGEFLTTMTSGDRLKNAAGFLSSALKTLYIGGIGIVEVFSSVGKVVGGSVAAILAALQGNFSEAWSTLKNVKSDFTSGWSEAGQKMKAAWETTGNASVDSAAKVLKSNKDLLAAQKEREAATKSSAGADKEAAKAARELEKAYEAVMKVAVDRAALRNAEINSIAAYMQGEEQARIATVKAANDSVRAAQDEYDNYGKTKSQIAEVTLARLNDKLQGVNAGTEIAASILREIDAQQQLIEILQKGEVREVGVEAAKATAAEWKKTTDDIERGLTDSLYRAFESGKGFFATLWSGITNLFKTTALKLIINPVSGALTSALGLGSTANAATGGGGIMGGLSNLSTLNTIGSTIANGFAATVGSSVGAIFGTVAGNTATGMALGLGSGSSLAAASAASVAGGGAAAGAGLSSAASVLGAIPGVGWAALAAVAVASIFGGRGAKETTGGGIEGNFSGAGFSGNSFSTWKQDGGWFHSDRDGKDTSGLDSATTKQFSDSYKAVQSAASSAAVALGLSADAVASYSERISIQLGKDAAANEKAVASLFSGLGDSMAVAVAPGVLLLAKEGETAGVTLSRLAGSLTGVNASLNLLDQKLLSVSLAGADSASKLVDLFGGFESLAAASQSFYSTYFSEAERAARSTEGMAKALNAFGLAMPGSKEAYRDLVTSLDLTTESGRQAYAVMLTLAPEFAAVADAMAVTATAALGKMFDSVADGIKTVISSIADARAAVRDAVLQINAPGAMTMAEIGRGIAGINTRLPGSAQFFQGSAAAAAADDMQQAQAASSRAAYQVAKLQADSYAASAASIRGILSASLVTTSGGVPTANQSLYNSNGDFRTAADAQLAWHQGKFGTGYTQYSDAGALQQQLADRLRPGVEASASPFDALAQQAQASANALFEAYTRDAAAAKVTQTNAADQARAAVEAYSSAMLDFAVDAGKSIAKLGTLRDETLKYYDAQQQLAALMTTSAAGLRESVRLTRMGQLDASQSLMQKRDDFSRNFSLALATTGAVQAGYADKLASALPDLSAALMDTASTRAEWALSTAKLMAQSDSVAALLDASAPKDYAADSLDMLGQIDAALAVLDSSSKSAEKIIADAVTAGSNKTADGLRAVIAALTGEAIPAFAAGGDHSGGLRIVGEHGRELEATGPSRIFNASQTRAMLSGGASADTGRLEALVQSLTQEVQGLRAEARATASHSAKTARILTRVTRDGEALQTVAAE